ncbi:hypothetical protein TBH_C2811 [Thiolapillus brandeum]|uniref:Uncharacterized protein n=2 Tax=Thiolapillus brandeum TaxID=1076588 RepID=A0A7U6JJP2_9GAMM|nr:hypothetical protein TBH_C2811 [Thiolapillus brandeum]
MFMKTSDAHAADQATEAVFICLKGIQGLGRKSLAFLFSTQAGKQYELTDNHPDAITIIDIDDYRGKAAWEEMRSQGQASAPKPAILIGLKPVDEEGAISLQKPFRTREILAAIDSLVERRQNQATTASMTLTKVTKGTAPGRKVNVSGNTGNRKSVLSSHAAASLNEKELHTFVGSANDVDLNDPTAIAAVQYSPEHFLAHHLGHLTTVALKERKFLQLGCCDAIFIVDPHKRCIHTDIGIRSQRSLGALPMGKPSAIRKLSELPAEIAAHGQCFSWEVFIWRMGLACSRGRLPEGTSLDQRFVLKRWPNLTRLMLFPHATRISAAWISAPLSLREILSRLSLPQRYVFAFFSAATATGLLVDAKTDGTVRKEEKASDQPSQRRGLFKRLLKTLYRKQGDNQA